MFLLRLSQGISSGCHHSTTKPIFWNCHYCGKGHYASASTQPRYFFRVPPCYPYNKFFWNCHYYGKGHYDSASTQPMYFFRVTPCHPYTQNFFWKCHYCGKGALCFRLDLASVFLLGATMKPLNPHTNFLELSLLWEGALCFSFDLAKVFLQGVVAPVNHI